MLSSLDTGTIGPITLLPSFTSTFGPLTSATHGILVSSILLGGSFSGLVAGNIADIYGRKETIVAGGVVYGLGAVLEGTSFKLPQFLVGRVLKGLGEGGFLGIVGVYICEIAPARRRG
jgi:MFS family permease